MDLINDFKNYFKSHNQTIYENPSPGNKKGGISSNTALYEQKKNWIDFNCGVLVEGTDIKTLRDQFFDYIIEVASGKYVKSEIAGFHDMAIFKQGVTL